MSERIASLRLIWLQALIATHESGTLSEAGRRVGASHPMIGRYLRQLEDWLGAPLFKHPGQVTLTPEGMKLIRVSREVLRLLDSVRHPQVGKVAAIEFHEVDSAPPHRAALSDSDIDELLRRWRDLDSLIQSLPLTRRNGASSDNAQHKAETKSGVAGERLKQGKGQEHH